MKLSFSATLPNAEGDENRASDIMKDLRRELAKIPDASSMHVLNGMFYEAYFDHEGKFRGDKLKDKHLARLFALETSSKFAVCIDFIRAGQSLTVTASAFFRAVLPNALR